MLNTIFDLDELIARLQDTHLSSIVSLEGQGKPHRRGTIQVSIFARQQWRQGWEDWGLGTGERIIRRKTSKIESSHVSKDLELGMALIIYRKMNALGLWSGRWELWIGKDGGWKHIESKLWGPIKQYKDGGLHPYGSREGEWWGLICFRAFSPNGQWTGRSLHRIHQSRRRKKETILSYPIFVITLSVSARK